MGIISNIRNRLSRNRRSQRASKPVGVSSSLSEPQNIGGITVTDTSSGESIKTTTNAQGEITSREYRPAPTGRGGKTNKQYGQVATTELVMEKSELVPAQPAPVSIAPKDTGGIKPNENKPKANVATNLQDANDPYAPVKRYKENPVNAFFNVAKNLNPFSDSSTYYLIGQKGFGEFTRQTFYEPFEYVGDINKPIGITGRQDIIKKALDVGAPVSLGYDESANKMIAEVGVSLPTLSKLETKKIYEDVGLEYTGAPVEILPSRLGESINKDLNKKYNKQFSQTEKGLFDYYQGQIDSGNLSLEEAQKRYKGAVNTYSNVVNQQYGQEFDTTFKARTGKDFDKRFSDAYSFSRESGEPPAFPIIRNVETVAKIGGTTALTAFGGSGGAFATSAIIGSSTFSQAIDYRKNYGQLTTEQKIIGGSNLALGAIGTFGTFNLGLNRFYGEWRSAIYQDLGSQTGKLTGKEVLIGKDFTRIRTTTIRTRGLNTATTRADTKIFTGETPNTALGVTKGTTTTKIFDPQTETFITTSQRFSNTATLTDIRKTSLSLDYGIKSKDLGKISFAEGTGRYRTSTDVQQYKFTTGAQNQDGYYNVFGSKTKATILTIERPKITSSTIIKSRGVERVIDISRPSTNREIIGNLDVYGRINKLQTSGGGSYFISGGGATRTSLDLQTSQISAGTSATVTQTAQQFRLNQLGTTTTSKKFFGFATNARNKNNVLTSELTTITQSQTRTFAPIISSVQFTEQKNTFPTVTPTGILRTVQRERIGITNFEGQGQTQQLQQPTAQTFRYGLITPAPPFTPTGTPYIPKLDFPLFDLKDLAGLSLPSRVIGGGRKNVAYTPSLSAYLYGITGRYKKTQLSATGLDFRPILVTTRRRKRRR